MTIFFDTFLDGKEDILKTYQAKLKDYRNAEELVDNMAMELARTRLVCEHLMKELSILQKIAVFSDYPLPIPQKKEDNEAFSSTITIEARSPLSQEDGFYHLEFLENGLGFRWTGVKSFFRFSLYLNRSVDLEFELKYVSSVFSMSKYSVNYSVNEDVNSAVLGDNSWKGFISACDSPLVNLVFNLPTVVKPCDVDSKSKDERQLGLAFHELIIKPAGARL